MKIFKKLQMKGETPLGMNFGDKDKRQNWVYIFIYYIINLKYSRVLNLHSQILKELAFYFWK